MTARRDNEWVRCGNCGHKLGKMIGVWPEKQAMPAFEMKCHSCKTLNYVMIGGGVKQNG